MFMLDFASVSFLIGVVLAFVLLALDKKEIERAVAISVVRCRGDTYIALALNLPIVANAQGITKGFRRITNLKVPNSSFALALECHYLTLSTLLSWKSAWSNLKRAMPSSRAQ